MVFKKRIAVLIKDIYQLLKYYCRIIAKISVFPKVKLRSAEMESRQFASSTSKGFTLTPFICTFITRTRTTFTDNENTLPEAFVLPNFFLDERATRDTSSVSSRRDRLTHVVIELFFACNFIKINLSVIINTTRQDEGEWQHYIRAIEKLFEYRSTWYGSVL